MNMFGTFPNMGGIKEQEMPATSGGKRVVGQEPANSQVKKSRQCRECFACLLYPNAEKCQKCLLVVTV